MVRVPEVKKMDAFPYELLEDPVRAKTLADRALEDVKEHHTFEAHAQSKLQAMQRLWEGSAQDLSP